MRLADGESLPYDVLVVATGAVLQPEETEGLTPGLDERVLTFYDARAARSRCATRWSASRADGWWSTSSTCRSSARSRRSSSRSSPTGTCSERGLRERIEIDLATPLDGAFTKPIASEHLAHLLDGEGDRARDRVRGRRGRRPRRAARVLRRARDPVRPAGDGAAARRRAVRRALAGPRRRAGLRPDRPAHVAGEGGDNVFAIGDATNLPTSKAGSVAHFEGDILVENVAPLPRGPRRSTAAFDGHANCFIETGFHKALLIDFNYEVEPLPGHFPAAVGRCRCCGSRGSNHLGKLAFQWLYWNVLLPGRTSRDRLERCRAPASNRRRAAGKEVRDDHDT